MKKKEHQTSITRFWLGEDGIARVIYLPDSVVTLEAAKEYIKSAMENDGESRPVLSDIRNVRGSTREARLFYASDEAASITKAVAILVNSPLSRVMGSFFIGLSKPKYPIKIFTDEVNAINWLKRFL